MLGGLVSSVVQRYLSAYFEHGEVVASGLGDVRVSALSLKIPVLGGNLPVRIRECTVGSAHVKVAPLKLFSGAEDAYAIVLRLDDVQVVLDERPEAEWQERDEFEALKEAKLQTIAALRTEAMQALETHLSGLSGSLEGKAAGDSAFGALTKRILSKLLNNVEVHVEDVHVSYHFKADSGRSGTVGLIFRSLRLENTNLEPVVTMPVVINSTQNAVRVPSAAPLAGAGQSSGLLEQASREDAHISGMLVEPVQGATVRIVRKQLRLDRLQVFLQENRVGHQSRRSELVEPFDVEALLAANLAADPGPTLAQVEVRVSEVAVAVEPEDVAALLFVSETLQRQVEWKAWCQQHFERMVRGELSTAEHREVFALYKAMIGAGKMPKDPRVVRPKPVAVPAVSESGVRDLLADLSWLEIQELRMPTTMVEGILASASALVAKRERERLKADSRRVGERLGSVRRFASWLAWAAGAEGGLDPPEASAEGAAGLDEEDLLESSAHATKVASELSQALGIETGEDEDRKRQHFRKVFEAIDKDGSGDIDAAELQIGLALAGTTLSSKAVLELIAEFDTDHNGTIDLEEFRRMCELAPSHLEQDKAGRKRAPVVAIALRFQGLRLAAGADAASEPCTDHVRLVCQVSAVDVAAAMEGWDQPAIGLKAFQLVVASADAFLDSRSGSKVLLLGSRPRRSSTEDAIAQTTSGESNATTETAGTAGGTAAEAASEALVESRITVAVLKVALTDGTSSDALPYCALFELDDAGEPCAHQTTALPAARAVGAGGRSEFSFCAGDDGAAENSLSFIAKHGTKSKRRFVQVQVRVRQGTSGWLRRFLGASSSTEPVEPESTDVLLSRTSVPISFASIKPSEQFSRTVHKSTSSDMWLPLEGGRGSVLVRIRRKRLGAARAAPVFRQGALEFRAAARTSLGYADIGAGLDVPRYYVHLDEVTVPRLQHLGDAFSGTLPWDGANQAGQEPGWRHTKKVLKLRFFQASGHDLGKVVSCKAECGMECVGLEPFTWNREITLGLTQNLAQVADMGPNGALRISFEMNRGRTLWLHGLQLARALQLSNVEESIMHCKLYDYEPSPEPQAIPSGAAEGGEIGRVCVAISVVNVGDEFANLTAEGDGAAAEGTAELGTEAADPWVLPDRADPLGLAVFPPLRDRPVVCLHVTVKRARNLRPLDLVGTSDPYCVLRCDDKEFTTPTVPDSLQPNWDALGEEGTSVEFGPLAGRSIAPTSMEYLQLDVMDDDGLGSRAGDLLGVAYVPLHGLYRDLALGADAAPEQRKRFEQHPLSFVQACGGKTLEMWIPLHQHDGEGSGDTDTSEPTSGAVDSGAVLLEFSMHPCRSWVQPVSVLPLHLDLTLVANVALPTIYVPPDNPFVGASRGIEIELGSPTVSLGLNEGASPELLGILHLDASCKPKGEQARVVRGASADETDLDDFRSLDNGDDDDDDDSGGGGDNGDGGDDDDMLSSAASMSSSRTRSRGRWLSRKDSSTSGYFSVRGMTQLQRTGSMRTDASDCESSGDKQQQQQEQDQATRKLLLPLAVDLSVDDVQLTILLCSRSRTGVRYPFLKCGIAGAQAVAKYAQYESLVPTFRVDLTVQELALWDLSQRHKILGQALRPNGIDGPQVSVAVSYELENGDDDDLACPTLAVEIQVNGVVVLATALLVFWGKVVDLLLTPTPAAEPRPVFPGSPGQADGQGATPSEHSPEPGSPEAREAAAQQAMFLPAQAVRVKCCMKSVEVHLMERRILGVSYGRVLRFPPKSLILRSTLRCSYSTAARRGNAARGQKSNLPAFEHLELQLVCSCVIAYSRLERHMFREEPVGFTRDGDNVVVEPFTVMLVMETRPTRNARVLRLTKSAGDGAALERRSDVSMGSTTSDSHLVAEASGDPTPSKDLAEAGLQAALGVPFARDDRRSWMLGSLTEEMRGDVKAMLDTSRLKRANITRLSEVHLRGLETRLDSSNLSFMSDVAELNMAILDGQAQERSPSGTNPEASLSARARPSSNTIESAGSMPGAGWAAAIESAAKNDPDSSAVLLSQAELNAKHTVESVGPVEKKAFADAADAETKMMAAVEEEQRARGKSRSSLNSLLRIGSGRTRRSGSRSGSDREAAEGPGTESGGGGGGGDATSDGDNADESPHPNAIPAWLLPVYVPMVVLCPTIAAFRPGQSDPSVMLSMDNDTDCLRLMAEQAVDMTAKEHVFDSARLNVSQLLLGLGNNLDGFPTPFVRVSVSALNLAGSSDSCFAADHLVQGFLALTSTAYNARVQAWEPLVEPWSLSLMSTKDRADDGAFMQAIAARRLNVNMTDVFLRGLARFTESLDPHFEPTDDERLHGLYAPNRVVNETGHSLELWPTCNPKAQRKSETPLLLRYRGKRQVYPIANHAASKVHLHDTSALRARMLELLEAHRAHKRRLALRTLRVLRGESKASAGLARAHTNGGSRPTKEAAAAEHYEDLVELFEVLDEDGSGELSNLELQRALSQSGQPVSVEEVLYSLGELDTDGVENVDAAETGISKEEFIEFFMGPETNQRSCSRASGLAVSTMSFRFTEDAAVAGPIFQAPIHAAGLVMLEAKGTASARNEAATPARAPAPAPAQTPAPVYSFPSQGSSSIWVVGNYQKMGRSSASDVLFLETPIRVENRALFRLEVALVCQKPGAGAGAGAGAERQHKTIFVLDPGEERSVPLEYLTAPDDATQGIAVRPTYGRQELHRLIGRKARTRLGSNIGSSDSDVLGNDTSGDESGRANTAAVCDWDYSPMLFSLDGGEGLTLLAQSRPEDRFPALSRLGEAERAPRPDGSVRGGILECSRVAFEKGDKGSGLASLVSRIEMVMLTQRNALRKFEGKPILTVQVLAAKSLPAADLNGLSDPYVKVTCGQEEFQTPAIKRTLNPVWAKNATTRFGQLKSLDKGATLKFTVYDKDTIGSDDLLCAAEVPVEEVIGWMRDSHQRGLPVEASISRVLTLKGVSGSRRGKARGSIKVALAFTDSTVPSDAPTPCAQHVFSFYPAAVLENALPHAIEVRIGTDRNDLDASQVLQLPPGTTMPLYGIDGMLLDFLDPSVQRSKAASATRPSACIMVRLAGNAEDGVAENDGWSPPLEAPDRAVSLLRDGARAGSCAAEVSRNPSRDGGSRRITIFASLWLVNRSSLALDYRAFEAKTGRPKGPDGISAWVQSDTNTGVDAIRCMHVSLDNGRLDVRARRQGFPASTTFVNDSDAPLLSNDKDLKAGLPCYVTLQGSKMAIDSDHAPGEVNIVVSLMSLSGLVVEPDVPFTAFCVCARLAAPSRFGGGENGSNGRAQALSGSTERSAGSLALPEPEAMSEVIVLDSNADGSVHWTGWSGLLSLEVPLCELRQSAVTLEVLRVQAGAGGVEYDVVGSGTVDLLSSPHFQKASLDDVKEMNINGLTLQYALSPTGLPVEGEPASRRGTWNSFNLAAMVEPLLGERALRTDVLTFQPRFLAANLSEVALLVKQAHAKDECAVLLRPRLPSAASSGPVRREENAADAANGTGADVDLGGSSIPFHFSTDSRSPDATAFAVQVRAAYPGAQWSAPFSFEDAEDFALQLRNSDGQRASRVWVDANRAGASNFIVFRHLSRSATPHVVQNMTDHTFAVVQVPSKKAGIVAAVKDAMKVCTERGVATVEDDEVALDLIEPGNELDLALDLAPREDLRVRVLVAAVTEEGTADMKRAEYIRFKPGLRETLRTADGREFNLVLSAQGSRLALRILDHDTIHSVTESFFRVARRQQDRQKSKSLRPSGSSIKARKRTSSRGHRDKVRGAIESVVPRVARERLAVKRAQEQYFSELEPKKPTLELLVRLSSIGISLFSSERHAEVAYLYVQRVHVEMSQEPVAQGGMDLVRTSLEVSVAHLQADSARAEATYPVVAYSRAPKRRAEKAVPVLCSVSARARRRTKLLSTRMREDRERNAFFRMQTVLDSDPSGRSSFDVYRYFRIRCNKLDVRLDSIFLAGTLALLKPVLLNTQYQGVLEGEGAVLGAQPPPPDGDPALAEVTKGLGAPIQVPPQDTVFLDTARVERTALVLSINIRSDDELKALFRDYGISFLYLGIVRRLSRVDQWSVDLKKGHYNTLTSEKFWRRHSWRIQRDVLRQLHEVAFNSTRRLFKRSNPMPGPIREPLVVGQDGALQVYGPGRRPRVLEEVEERRAAMVLERFFYRSVQKSQAAEDGAEDAGESPRASQRGWARASLRDLRPSWATAGRRPANHRRGGGGGGGGCGMLCGCSSSSNNP